ncbi:Rv3235 family protein [Kitasatospora sp. NPDC057223]|uniref:Rv3235 family protein n=1 Tax=Kitasatospora sp. NPDC057223 TaxID=3346055 RepID=UPI00362F1B64
MTESSAAPRSAVRHARPLPPAVRTPRIRPLARPAAPAPAETADAVPHTRLPAAGGPAPHRAPARPVRHPRGACAAPPEAAAAARARAERAELAARFAHRLVEVLTGVRPAGQLQRHTTLDGYGRLTALVRSGPLRPRGAAARPRLGRVHDSAPAAGVVEACVLVGSGSRHHMVAFRLERQRRTGAWQCAVVEAR